MGPAAGLAGAGAASAAGAAGSTGAGFSAAGLGAGLGAPGPGAAFAGCLEGACAAGSPDGVLNLSRIMRSTGASSVEDADRTNSPADFSSDSRVLLSTPSCLASS